MNFRDICNKAVKKASELKDSKPVSEMLDKTVEYLTGPKSAKQHFQNGAVNAVFNVAAAAVTGGASIPVSIAFAVAEEVALTTFAKTRIAKDIAANYQRSKKPGPPKDGHSPH
jgi:hypothetical protein